MTASRFLFISVRIEPFFKPVEIDEYLSTDPDNRAIKPVPRDDLVLAVDPIAGLENVVT